MAKKREQIEEDSGNELAGIEYAGIGGSSKDCQDAVLRIIQFGTPIPRTAILTAGRDHCLLLTINEGDEVAIKSGFASGYGGEGPRRFSYVLRALESFGAEIEEYDVDEGFLERIDRSALTGRDLEALANSRPRRPSRWHDYIHEEDFNRAREGTLWHDEFPAIVPFAVIDSRIMDLALDFWTNPDNSLLGGYRRLEDIVRERTGIVHHGTKLFSQAFNPDGGSLTWKDVDEGERAGRMQLFTGTFAAHRNPRAHREPKDRSAELLREFLVLNHLYALESQAISNPNLVTKNPIQRASR